MVPDPSPVRTAGADPDVEAETETELEADDLESDRSARTFRHYGSVPGGAAAESNADAASEGGYACPLCGFSHEVRDAVYTHLVFGHRKRAISSALLERQTDGAAME